MSLQQRPAVAWTIAGSDSGGGAGIQADLKTFHDFDVHGCSVITALTAQNSIAVGLVQPTPHKTLVAQINALDSDLPADAIKLGMLPNVETVECVIKYLDDYQGIVVCDPVLKASSGDALVQAEVTRLIREKLLSRVTLLTPNRDEAAALVGSAINNCEDIERAAEHLLELGPAAVIITGGHFDPVNGQCLDYFCSRDQRFWLAGEFIHSVHSHGSGCTLSSAITATLARGYELADALVLAKMYVTCGFRYARQLGGGPGPVAHRRDFLRMENLPGLSLAPATTPLSFASCEALGLYPVMDSADWIERLLKLGVKTVQLRIKDQPEDVLRREIQQSVALARKHDAQLFINDYWQLAIEYGAYGVHLGQEDLDSADLHAIANAGLRLGVSTHSFYEIARAHAVRPSYIAIGPIYNTTTKQMKFGPQGLQQLKIWVDLLAPTYPLTAIGGISVERVTEVLATGIDSCAMVTAISLASDVEDTVARLLALHAHTSSAVAP